jgi:hypothetical protein
VELERIPQAAAYFTSHGPIIQDTSRPQLFGADGLSSQTQELLYHILYCGSFESKVSFSVDLFSISDVDNSGQMDSDSLRTFLFQFPRTFLSIPSLRDRTSGSSRISGLHRGFYQDQDSITLRLLCSGRLCAVMRFSHLPLHSSLGEVTWNGGMLRCTLVFVETSMTFGSNRIAWTSRTIITSLDHHSRRQRIAAFFCDWVVISIAGP